MRYLLSIILILALSTQYSYSEKFDIDPISVNYSGLIQNDGTTIVWGDVGTVIISYNYDKTWRKAKIFRRGWIINMFWNNNRITAINSFGDFCISDNRGKSWQLRSSLEDEVLAATETSDGYFIRTSRELKILSKKFSVLNSFPLISIEEDYIYTYRNRHSIASFREYLIAEIDSSKHIVLDIEMNSVDTIDYRTMGFGNNDETYRIFSDDNYLYYKFGSTIYRTSDLKNTEAVYECDPTFLMYGMGENGHVYVLDSTHYKQKQYSSYNDSCKFVLHNITESQIPEITRNFEYTYPREMEYYQNMFISDNNLYLLGRGNLIFKNAYPETEFSIISYRQNSGLTIKNIDSDTLLFLSGEKNGRFYPSITYSSDSCATFHSYVDKDDSREITKYSMMNFTYYNKDSKSLYLGGYNSKTKIDTLMISKDNGKTFEYRDLGSYDNSTIFSPFSNVCENQEGFVAVAYDVLGYNLALGKFIYYNNNFEEYLVQPFLQNNIIHFTYAPNMSYCLSYSYQSRDSTYKFRYTDDGFNSLKDLKTYSKSNIMVRIEDLEHKGRKYAALINYNKIDSVYTIETIDLETREFSTVFKYTSDYKKPHPGRGCHYYIDIMSHKDTVYVCLLDTLYFTTDIFDSSSWKHHILPDNGRFYSNISKLDNRFYSRYFDNNHSIGNYWFTLTHDTHDNGIRITTEDNTFEPTHFEDYETEALSISNQSQTSELIITARSQLHGHAFTTDLPLMTPDEPLVIPAGESFDYELKFKPVEVKDYRDSIIFYSNAMGTDSIARFSGSGIDTTTSIDEVESGSYLYAYPPYPMPAKGLVRSLIYFDNQIFAEDVEIFDRFGEKVGGQDDISIDKVKSYSAILSWNCSGVATGVYFIRVRNGEKMKVLKVIVKK